MNRPIVRRNRSSVIWAPTILRPYMPRLHSTAHDVEKNSEDDEMRETNSDMPTEAALSDPDKSVGRESLDTNIDADSNSSRPSMDTVVGTASMHTPSIKSLKALDKAPTQKVPEEEIPYVLPNKHGSKLTRYLYHTFFTGYRKLFTLIFTANLAAFIGIIARYRGAPLAPAVANAASANLMVAILFRQENFINLVYEICTCAPHSLPLVIRKRLAKVFHYGGCHSGCGVAAVVWYLLYTAIATKEFVETPSSTAAADLATSWILTTMFTFIVGSAHPKFRVKFHDHFEAVHRFAGWTTLCTFWIHTFLSAAALRSEGENIWLYLVKTSNFWTLGISTSCTIISWSRLRYRDVFPEVLSDHATRLHFKHKHMRPFYGIKLSCSPLLEWHAFATIPDDAEGFSVVVSNAGDWTKKHILNPPKKLWIRGYPLHGLLFTSKLFKRIVVVATGSGIGPCLSLMFADITPQRILWSTPNPETTYGPKVMASVLKADPNAIIWNTRSQGRPDMLALTHKLYRESDAEAVFVISNPKVTRKVVYGMESRGIAAYGAIFDS